MHLSMRGWSAGAALITGALVAPLAIALPASASATGNEVVFVEESYSDVTGQVSDAVVLQSADGSHRVELTAGSDGAHEAYPELSPDGSRVVFTSDRLGTYGLLVVNRDGSGLRRLTTAPDGQADDEPTWTPDGQDVVFTREDETTQSILRVPAGGGTPQPTGFDGTAPDVAGDGRLVFRGADGGLYVAPLAGGTPTPLDQQGEQPAWSPDGSEIAYIRLNEPVANDLGSRLHVVSPDGAGDRTLGEAESVGEPNGLYGIDEPHWLPDGQSLVYAALTFDADGMLRGRLYAIDRLGTRAGALLPPNDPGVDQYLGHAQGPAPADVSGAAAASRFVPVPPVRAFDSRAGQLPVTGPKGRIPAGGSVSVNLPSLPADATAAVLNVTVVDPSASTYVTAFPTGTTAPLASNVNVVVHGIVPNSVTVKLGPGGSVSLRNAQGDTDLIVDLAGYYRPTQTAGPDSAGFTSIAPQRAYDSRPGTSPAGNKGLLGPGGFVDVQVAGSGALPSVPGDATAVVLNLTGIQASTGTLLRVYPTPASGNAVPLVSNLNLVPHVNTANLAVVAVGDGGRVRLRNDLGTVDAILDVAGYYSPSSAGEFVPVDPLRFLDTRTGTGAAPLSMGAGQYVDLRVANARGIPAGASAVAANLTAVIPDAATLLRAYPADSSTVPTVSNLNLLPGQIRANAAYLVPDASGRVRIRNDQGNVHVLADVAGYFVAVG